MFLRIIATVALACLASEGALADHFNANLGDTTTRTSTTKTFGDTSVFNLFFILEIDYF